MKRYIYFACALNLFNINIYSMDKQNPASKTPQALVDVKSLPIEIQKLLLREQKEAMKNAFFNSSCSGSPVETLLQPNPNADKEDYIFPGYYRNN